MQADLGIGAPEELWPLSREDYLACYLAADPIAAMRAYLSTHTDAADVATEFLERQHLLRVLKIANVNERVEKLLPLYGCSRSWVANDAERGLIDAGAVAGPYLLGLFQESDDFRVSPTRAEIIDIWGKIRWAGAVEPITKLLKDDDQFWAERNLPPDWSPEKSGQYDVEVARDVYSRDYSGIYALALIGDPRSIATIQHVLDRWKSMKGDKRQMVDGCNDDLKLLERASKAK